MPELLLELLSEEIPARMQAAAAAQLQNLVTGMLGEQRLTFISARSFATPRRLTLAMDGLPASQEGYAEPRFGPRKGAPQAAIDGFMRSLAGKSTGEPEWRDDGKGEKLCVEIRHPGRLTGEVLAEQVPLLLGRFAWPKSMRWGAGEARWVRPLHAILCLLDGEVVRFEFAGVGSGDVSRGHRFMAPEPFRVREFADYVRKLHEHYVLLDAAERRELILDGAGKLAAGEGLVLRDDPALLDELAGLVEWPVPLLARIDAGFMDIPPEVLVLTMRQNQKYLALETADGRLADRFVVVANIEAPDGGAAIVAGNERVLRARFWDARHFWEQDRKRQLETGLPRLERMVFHADLGTQSERVQRLVALTGSLAPYVPGAERASAERAALLAKADLVSGMVGEFPELQGVMGGHYARAQGESEAVAKAIAEHYSPRGPDDRCPTAPASVAVALADRLDSLVGFFGRGIRPTGSKDPFALRRAALGVIRLILENGLRLPIGAAVAAAREGYGARLAETDGLGLSREILSFLTERLKVHLRERGVRHDLVSAVFAAGEDDDLVRLLARVDALDRFLGSDDGRNLLVAYRRAGNIVGIEEKRDGRAYAGTPRPELWREPAEQELGLGLERAGRSIGTALETEDFAGAMTALAGLRRPVDTFFDLVLVNVDDAELRVNRLLSLNQLRSALSTVADFSLIEDAARG
jgi:glycyl-tRNA synthetase beta chain